MWFCKEEWLWRTALNQRSLSPLIIGLVLAQSGHGTDVGVYWSWVAHSLFDVPTLGGETIANRDYWQQSQAIFLPCSHIFHQLPYVIDLWGEWVFCPGRALWYSKHELGVLLWGNLFHPCVLSLFLQFSRLSQFKKRNSSSYLGGIAEVDLGLSYFFFCYYFAVHDVSWDNTENQESAGVIFEDHWTRNKIPSRVQDQHRMRSLSPVVCVLTLSCSLVLDLCFLFSDKTRIILWEPIQTTITTQKHGYLKKKHNKTYKNNTKKIESNSGGLHTWMKIDLRAFLEQ